MLGGSFGVPAEEYSALLDRKVWVRRPKRSFGDARFAPRLAVGDVISDPPRVGDTVVTLNTIPDGMTPTLESTTLSVPSPGVCRPSSNFVLTVSWV
jgi:hypothetical protein